MVRKRSPRQRESTRVTSRPPRSRAGALPPRSSHDSGAPAKAPARGLVIAIVAGLAVATLVAYAPVRQFDFVDLDDSWYVYQNPSVLAGLTWSSIAWAFTTGHAANWHPLTWLSHMTDVDLFGPAPGPHHAVNLALHVAATLVLFGWWRQMTGAVGRSAFVAALFALHPLHVESVAWVSERKDVLSSVLWFLTAWAYTAHVSASSQFWRRRAGYAVVIALYAMGLLAKPMLVTLPFTLLLLDVWPLRRIDPRLSPRAWLRLFVEKAPLFALAAASSAITFVVQRQGGAVSALEAMPGATRFANALVAYVVYLRKTIWPVDLAVFYPYPPGFNIWFVAGCATFLLVITALVIRVGDRWPYAFVGWLWYVGTLVPVIGLVQVGTQAMADRYTYIPLIGIFALVAWGAVDLLGRYARAALPAAAVVVILMSAAATRAQVLHWRDSLAIWQHAVAVTAGNYRAHNSLGAVLGNQGRTAEAIVQFEEALRLRPDHSEAHHIHHNLGRALADTGRLNDSLPHYREALRIKPDFAEAHNNLGLALASLGRFDEARQHYERALQAAPSMAIAHNNLGLALHGLGRPDEAIARYTEAIRLDPAYAEAYNNRGYVHGSAGRSDPAIADFSTAVQASSGVPAGAIQPGAGARQHRALRRSA